MVVRTSDIFHCNCYTSKLNEAIYVKTLRTTVLELQGSATLREPAEKLIRFLQREFNSLEEPRLVLDNCISYIRNWYKTNKELEIKEAFRFIDEEKEK